MGKFIDLTGQKFGRLTVINRAENQGTQTRWRCQCECGKQKKVQSGALRRRDGTRSCGCIAGDIGREALNAYHDRQNDDDEIEYLYGTPLEDIVGTHGHRFG